MSRFPIPVKTHPSDGSNNGGSPSSSFFFFTSFSSVFPQNQLPDALLSSCTCTSCCSASPNLETTISTNPLFLSVSAQFLNHSLSLSSNSFPGTAPAILIAPSDSTSTTGLPPITGSHLTQAHLIQYFSILFPKAALSIFVQHSSIVPYWKQNPLCAFLI